MRATVVHRAATAFRRSLASPLKVTSCASSADAASARTQFKCQVQGVARRRAVAAFTASSIERCEDIHALSDFSASGAAPLALALQGAVPLAHSLSQTPTHSWWRRQQRRIRWSPVRRPRSTSPDGFTP